MDDESLTLLSNGNEEDLRNILTKFTTENAQCFSLTKFSKENKKKLVDILLKRLQDPTFCSSHAICLETYRILSREKQDLDEVFTRDVINFLVSTAGLYSEEEVLSGKTNPKEDFKVIVETLKSLCNLIYNSPSVQRICSSNSTVEGIMLRLRTYSEKEWSHEIKFFDMRMLFLLTALCADIRPRLRREHHGLIYLTEVLDLIIKTNIEERLKPTSNSNQTFKKRFSRGSKRGWEQSTIERNDGKIVELLPSSPPPCLSDDEVAMASEVLKVLYNLTVNMDKHNVDEEDEAHFLRLVCILHDILLCAAKTSEKKEELQSNTVALLMNIPPPCFEELLTSIEDVNIAGKNYPKDFEFYGMNVEAVAVLLNYLDKKLDQPQSNLSQSLMPILGCLIKISQSNRIIRKYMKSRILPPLKDVMNRPEEGTTLRNKLVRLMTSPSIQIKKLVANLLFVLCKENAARLVKYTGYGNAAGLLASMGLMRGGTSEGGANYSSDSEDSDTEEYLQYKEKINMVTGCYEEPKPNPLEGMSDEQKEYEAMQLVNMIERLTADGVIKPGVIGDDGRPVPVEHILELQNALGQNKDKK